MMTIEPGVLVAIFVTIIGSYAFTFTAWRVTSNHVSSKLDGLDDDLAKLHVEMTDRLARIETTINSEKKK